MATEAEDRGGGAGIGMVVEGLESTRWNTVIVAVGDAERWIKSAKPGDPAIHRLAESIAELGKHEKWEVRHAVATLAGRLQLPAFEAMLIRLRGDENDRVRVAAREAQVRRRDWRSASTMGRDQEKIVNATLDEIERRFGVTGRVAVRRASDSIANMFAREVYHELIRFISPVVTEAERLEEFATSADASAEGARIVSRAAGRVSAQMNQLRAVLEAMRDYAAEHTLEFEKEPIAAIVEYSVQVAVGSARAKGRVRIPAIEVAVAADLKAEVARARLSQAFTNVLTNAIEAYDGLPEPHSGITVTGVGGDGFVELRVTDQGCGMSDATLQDARKLFATSKKERGGSGVGLSLACRIVETEHDGRLELTSEKGRGTVVTITLPILKSR